MSARRGVKRAIDLVIAAVASILLLPVMGVIAVVTLLAHGRPILFRQVRVGLSGEQFTLGKFRTMTDARDASGRLQPDEQRLTATGRILRRFRLDELPSFLRVISGEMSLVGPRPLPPEILATIPGSSGRHRVRPGFTGLAQVSGNTLLTNQEKIALDLLYVETWSVAGDLRILLKTIATIIAGEARDERLIERALAAQPRFPPANPAAAEVRGR